MLNKHLTVRRRLRFRYFLAVVSVAIIPKAIAQADNLTSVEDPSSNLIQPNSVNSNQVNAQSKLCPQDLARPCVALVLGGGGARGGAHVGALQALEELGIPVDYVVGTSIGSFVGGLYASGRSPAEIKTLFGEADWNAGYRDDLSRDRIPNRRKRQLDNYQIHLDLGVGAAGIKLPQGLLRGQGMKNLIDNMLGRYAYYGDFDDLPIPFRAVAADIETGEEIVLSDGDLASALQISMSLPGILRPVERDGRLLVDGGIANNLPISIAKDLGADVVIAIHIGSNALTQEQLRSGVTIYNQMAAILTRKNVADQEALLTSNDVFIRPDIEDVTLLDFNHTLDAFIAGYDAVIQSAKTNPALKPLTNLRINPATLDRQRRVTSTNAEIVIDEINLSNLSRLSDVYVLDRMQLREGASYSSDDIQDGIDRLYGQGTIVRIDSTLQNDDGKNQLNLDVQEKEWGPGYMDFKINFEDNFESFSRYQIGASYRLTNLSPYGAEWFTAGEFGTEKLFTTELYWPIKTTGFFWDASANYERQVFEFVDEGDSLGNVESDATTAIAGVGWTTDDHFDTLIGGIYIDGSSDVPPILAALLGIDNIPFKRSGAVWEFNYDSLDNVSFPTRGVKTNVTIARTKDEVLNLSDYSTQADVELSAVASLGRHSLSGRMRFQSTINDEPTSLLGRFSLGGFLNLSGNGKNSLSGQHIRFFSLIYSYELASNDFGALALPLYLGASAETGNVWDDRKEIDYGDLITSGSLFVGWDSPFGPAYLAYGSSDTGEESFYVYLGIVF